jgi:hypothetical protein
MVKLPFIGNQTGDYFTILGYSSERVEPYVGSTQRLSRALGGIDDGGIRTHKGRETRRF